MWVPTVFLMALAAVGNTNPTVPVYDTIIVGMGAAGCTAASILCKAGKNVLALEAQNRIGGRVYTLPFGDGVVEVGAEWIHGSRPSRVYDFALQHNISILTQNTNFQVYRSDGSNADKDLITELVNVGVAASFESTNESKSVGQHVIKRVTDYIKTNHSALLNDKEFVDYFFHFMNVMTSSYEGLNNWNEPSTYSKFQDQEGDLHLSWNKLGYKTLIEILLNKYKGGVGYPTLSVQLEKVVTKITYPQDPAQDVEVTCKDGATYKAKNVIVTVSAGVLKESYTTLFSPALPEAKISALKGISMGLIGKIILLFPNQWWEHNNSDAGSFFWRKEDKKNLEEDFTFEIAGVTVSMGNRNAITLWSSGNTTQTIESLPEDVVKTKAMALVRRFLGKGKTVPEPINMIRTNWYSNPYIRGIYSYENLQGPQNLNVRATLAQPIVDSSGAPRVLFAGEATNSKHFSTVHGAVETGYREATRLLPKAA